MVFALPGLEGGKQASWRQIMTGVCVLTLATVGNAILPIPYAFAISGAVASTLIIVFVALSNVFTCRLLLRGAVATGSADYEQLGFAVGGRWVKLWTELWIVLLLIGTNIGAIIQMGESFGYAVETQWPDSPAWLWDRSGTAAQLFFTLAIIFPLSMLPEMRKLEMVGAFGSSILWVLAVIVMVKAISNGMPALSSGDFPHVSSGDLNSISETFSLLCFAFYHQVMMMPLLSEMPRVSSEAARQNAKDLNRASAITILGTSGLTYWVVGFFGASMYGATNISANVCENEWLPGVGTFVLNLLITLYLAVSIPPIFHATNHTVGAWLLALFPRGFGGQKAWVQRFITNCCTILPCLGVALGVPGKSGTVLSFTGATGVSMCSYMLPVVFHFLLYFGKARCMRLSEGGRARGSGPPHIETLEAAHVPANELDYAQLSSSSSSKSGIFGIDSPYSKAKDAKFDPHPDAPPGLMWAYRKPRHPFMIFAYELLLPVLVLALGIFFSIATLVLLFQPSDE